MSVERQQVILLAEDDPNDVFFLVRVFQKARVSNPLRVKNDGEQAIAYLAGQPPFQDRARDPLPVLILLDLKLPRRSGLEVLEWIKDQPDLRGIPTFVLTSSAESLDVQRACELGANSYLIKPVGPEDLLSMVERVGLYWLVTNVRPQTAGRAAGAS